MSHSRKLAILISAGVVGLALIGYGAYCLRGNPELKQANEHTDASKQAESQFYDQGVKRISALDADFHKLDTQFNGQYKAEVDKIAAGTPVAQADIDQANGTLAQMTSGINQMDQTLAAMDEQDGTIASDRQQASDHLGMAAGSSPSGWLGQYVDKATQVNSLQVDWNRTTYALASTTVESDRLDLQTKQAGQTLTQKTLGAAASGDAAAAQAALSEFNGQRSAINAQAQQNDAQAKQYSTHIGQLNEQIKQLNRERSQIVSDNWYRALLGGNRQVFDQS